MKKEIKINKCFCGADVCLCCTRLNNNQDMLVWRIHCEDCDWSFGGSTLPICRSKMKVVNEWNRQTEKVARINEDIQKMLRDEG